MYRGIAISRSDTTPSSIARLGGVVLLRERNSCLTRPFNQTQNIDGGHEHWSIEAAVLPLGRFYLVFSQHLVDELALWRRNHARHHASSGNLDQRGSGDIDTLTVSEFAARPRWRQILYRLYRHPIVMFGVGPTYLFILRYRLPIGMMRNGWRPWLSTMGTNLAIAVLIAGMIWLVGLGPFLLVHLPIVVLAASIGVWLFYVQHQFEDTSWSRDEAWSFHEAALHGSSHYHLPGVLRWFTANIGVHHVHHLCSRIPCYRLPDVLRDHPELAAVGRITLLQSLRCVPRALWDEKGRRLISFREADIGQRPGLKRSPFA